MEELKVKKVTKKEKLGTIKNIFFGVKLDIPEDTKEDLIKFIDHEIELLNKKASASGQSKTQAENEKIKVVIAEELTKLARAVTISELQKENNVQNC